MKKILCWILLISVLFTVSGCSLFNNGGYDTPEEAATAFVKATIEKDMELFTSCVHPNMLEKWISEWDMDDAPRSLVDDIRMGRPNYLSDLAANDPKMQEDLEELYEDFYDDYGIAVEEYCVIDMIIKWTSLKSGEQDGKTEDCELFCVDGSWYAFGWN